MGETGLEPAQVLPYNVLSVARMPIPPLAHVKLSYYTLLIAEQVTAGAEEGI